MEAQINIDISQKNKLPPDALYRASGGSFISAINSLAQFVKKQSTASQSALARNRKVTTWAREQGALGEKVLVPVPPVMLSAAAQATAEAK